MTRNLSGISDACVTWRKQGSTSCRKERIWFGILYFKQLHAAEEFLKTQQFLSQPRIFPHIMEPECSSPLSQEHSICPYPKPDQCNPRPKPICQGLSLILSSYACLVPSNLFFPWGFPRKILNAPLPIRATCIALIILLHLMRNFHETLIIRYTLTKIIGRITTVTFALQLCISLAQRLKQATRPSTVVSLFILT